MLPMLSRRSKRMVLMSGPFGEVCDASPRTESRRLTGLGGLAGNDWQQKMRGSVGVPIDAMCHGLAAADVVRDVFHVGHRTGSRRHIHARDLETDSMSRL